MGRGLGVLVAITVLLAGDVAPGGEGTWKAGAAKTVITPEEPLWMAGYGGRTEPADGTLHDLWVKALALEDAQGNRAVVVATDTLGIPKGIYDNVCAELSKRCGLDRARIMLNSSHTHCGPVLRGALLDIYPLDDEQRSRIEAYSSRLEAKIVSTVERALGAMKPASLLRGSGVARFAVNRRENKSADVPRLRAEGKLRGPIDHEVPVLAVRSSEGALMAVVFGYACHNTTLSFQKWCGDYAGFAQIALERAHPDAVALFHMGCGADQNPLPRRTVELCQQYGTRLAGAVEDVLKQPMKPIEPKLGVAYELVPLPLGDPPTRKELTALSLSKAEYRQRWAKRLLNEMDRGVEWERTVPYPIQVWSLGADLLWVSLGGEVVVDYALRLKREIDGPLWVTGYANDVMAYIPSVRVLQEGGYEGATSMMVYGMAAHRWAPEIEERIVATVGRLAKKAAEARRTEKNQ